MLIDGEKYACEACVRGHRVSNCQHSDRPLQHINKKGRPVSQCAHCRAMRKSRSAHVKCDCGIKPNKCIHLQPRVNGHTPTCCCNHGGACTCACSSDGSVSTASDVSFKSGARPRRANTLHAPPRSTMSKPAQQKLRSRTSPMHGGRVAPLATRRSAASLHGLAAGHHDSASGDTTPEEGGSPQPDEVMSTSLPGNPVAPFELTRAATFPTTTTSSYVQNVGGYDFASLGGFSDSEGAAAGPLYSAGLATPPNMWGGAAGELFMPPAPPSYAGSNSLPRSTNTPMFDFDFAMAPDSYSERSSDHLPNLAAGSSGEVSEADDNHSPHALDAGDFMQDQPDFEGIMPQPEIFDDAPLFYTFDEEFQALGYSEGGYTAEKVPQEYNYWAPSP